MAVGPHRFLITELQLLKVPFLRSVSLRAETGNFSLPRPHFPLPASSAPYKLLLTAAKIYGIDPRMEGGRADCDPKEG